MKITVDLNGTAVNPYHLYGLKQNPFSQLSKSEYDSAIMTIQSLGADPIPNIYYIRERLKGFSDEFVELCVSKYIPGKMVSFTVEFPG
jgi:hypothetical protein